MSVPPNRPPLTSSREDKAAMESTSDPLAHLRAKAAAGDPLSQMELGLALAVGGPDTPADKAAAFGWLSKAAANNLPEAQYNLGVCYAQGIGAPVDPKKPPISFKPRP